MMTRTLIGTLPVLIGWILLTFAIAVGQSEVADKPGQWFNRNFDEWQVMDLGDLSVSVPPGITVAERGCRGCITLNGLPEGIKILGSLEPPTWRPSDRTREERAWVEEFIKVDGRRVWIWSYKSKTHTNETEFIYGMNTDYPRPLTGRGVMPEWSIGLQIWSKTDQSEFANIVFRSVRFPSARTSSSTPR